MLASCSHSTIDFNNSKYPNLTSIREKATPYAITNGSAWAGLPARLSSLPIEFDNLHATTRLMITCHLPSVHHQIPIEFNTLVRAWHYSHASADTGYADCPTQA